MNGKILRNRSISLLMAMSAVATTGYASDGKLEDIDLDGNCTKKSVFSGKIFRGSHARSNVRMRVEAGVLCMRPTIDQLEFSMKSSKEALSHNSITDKAVKDIRYDWETGFRFYAGWQFMTSGWEVALRWTHIGGDSTGLDKSDKPTIVPLLLNRPGLSPLPAAYQSDFAKVARAKWSLDLNLIDLEWGHKYSLSSKLETRPYFGAQIVINEQKAEVKYDDIFFTTSVAFPTFFPFGSRSCHLKRNAASIGPRFGVDTRWNFFEHFSLKGEMSGTILLGREDRDRKYRGDIPAVAAPNTLEATTFNVKESEKSATYLFPLLQAALSLDYENTWFDETKIGWQIGYGSYHLWKQSVVSDQDRLQVKGLHGSVRVEF